MPDKNKVQLDEPTLRMLRSFDRSLQRIADALDPQPADETGVKRLTEPCNGPVSGNKGETAFNE